jgi:hypothetical protein
MKKSTRKGMIVVESDLRIMQDWLGSMHRALKQKEGWVQGRDELLCGIILNDFSPALCRQQIDGRNA